MFKIVVNELSNRKSKLSAEMSLDIDNPHLMGIELHTKLGQYMHAQASKGLPSAGKFYLSQKRVRRFLKDLIKASNSCCWGPVTNADAKKGIKSSLF